MRGNIILKGSSTPRRSKNSNRYRAAASACFAHICVFAVAAYAMKDLWLVALIAVAVLVALFILTATI